MNDQEYLESCKRTEKDLPQDRLADITLLSAVLQLVADAGDLLDLVKKREFYGSKIPTADLVSAARVVKDSQVAVNYALVLPKDKQTTPVNWRTLHGIVGVAGEAAELARRAHKALRRETAFTDDDRTNLVEEIGDGFFYNAILMDSIKTTACQVKQKNQAKLQARYKKGFSLEECENRNLEAEKAALQA